MIMTQHHDISPVSYAVTLPLDNEGATMRLAAMVAHILRPGDLVTLGGDLGTGKTTFARHTIRALANDKKLEVPSPTFTIVQTYDTPRAPVVHADLYRLTSPQELAEVGWDEAGPESIVLVEWPERAGDSVSHDRLSVELTLADENPESARNITLNGVGSWAKRLARALDIYVFLEEHGWAEASRDLIQGDASGRSYERLTHPDGREAILMDAPRRPDGPPVKDGKSYSVLAKLAEDVKPFVALAEGLKERGFSAPGILARDMNRGLLLLEDMGSESLLNKGVPEPERHKVAVDVLVRLHGLALPDTLLAGDPASYSIPPYDIDALLAEVELFIQWYLPRLGHQPDASARNEFLQLWRQALEPVLAEKPTWVLRDYHSPNLMWLNDRESLARVGILDFQDALMGNPAYDVVSLLQDARIDIPEALELNLLSRYVGGRRMSDVEFDAAGFARSYAVLGAQRATKILGIFVRLQVRDGKPHYLKHLPRVMHYLARDLAHPHLETLFKWYDGFLHDSKAGAA
jgi:tRNA threonylcarbamoyl adenosine modification protein YjeE